MCRRNRRVVKVCDPKVCGEALKPAELDSSNEFRPMDWNDGLAEVLKVTVDAPFGVVEQLKAMP